MRVENLTAAIFLQPSGDDEGLEFLPGVCRSLQQAGVLPEGSYIPWLMVGLEEEAAGILPSRRRHRRSGPDKNVPPYIVCIIGAPPHLTVSVRLGRREFIPIIDSKDKEFIYWLDQPLKGLGYVPFEAVCIIYSDKKTISSEENWAYIAHQRVNKFRDRLRRKGLDPDRLFQPERGRGFRRVFRRGKG